MELLQNETTLKNIDTTQIMCGTIEEDDIDELSGNSEQLEKWVFWGGEGGGGAPITWHNKFFNQLDISPWSCFYMANWTALANTFNVDIPFSIIQEGWNDLVANGGFIPNVGGKASTGTFYALKHFNAFTGKNVQSKTLPFNIQNIVTALKSGSDFVFGLKYGKTFGKNEQDDGIIQNIEGTIGNQGHLVCGNKANTMFDYLVKYAEQYHGAPGITHDIILLDISKYPGLFQNNLTYFIK